MAEKKWRPVGGGTLVKWDTVGKTLEGIYQGQHDGKFGPLGDLTQADGSRVSFPLHTALLERIKRVKEGAEVRIIYTGKATSKAGQEYKAFDLYVADDDMVKSELDDDEVPF